jgi:hypothetical protein
MEAPDFEVHAPPDIVRALLGEKTLPPDTKRLRTIAAQEHLLRTRLLAEYAVELSGGARSIEQITADRQQSEHLISGAQLSGFEAEWQAKHLSELHCEYELAHALREQLGIAQTFYGETYVIDGVIQGDALEALYDATDRYADMGCFEALHTIAAETDGSKADTTEAERLLRIVLASELHILT